MENMQRCYDLIFGGEGLLAERDTVTVLDLGAQDVNGSYRTVFDQPHFEFIGADLEAGRGVDIVLDDPYVLPFEDESVDVVLSGQMLEHCEFFWNAFAEMARVVRPDGFIILIAPSAGPIHRYPVDCYRFYPDAYAALAKFAGCHLLNLVHDERGPWYDLVGIFSKQPQELPERPHRGRLKLDLPVEAAEPELEVRRGQVPYRDVLTAVHERLKPRSYLEIGVRDGGSLRLAKCPSIAVDPLPRMGRVPDKVSLYEATSDDFFAYDAEKALTTAPDLVFIDGMHLFEYVLRDFMNVERHAHPGTLVIIDDIFPNHPAQGSRDRRTNVWMGDVWKIVQCLRQERPQLRLDLLDTEPSGLLLVAGLDPDDRKLWSDYNRIMRLYATEEFGEPPPDVVGRKGAITPTDPTIPQLIDVLREARKPAPKVARVRRGLRSITATTPA